MRLPRWLRRAMKGWPPALTVRGILPQPPLNRRELTMPTGQPLRPMVVGTARCARKGHRRADLAGRCPRCGHDFFKYLGRKSA